MNGIFTYSVTVCEENLAAHKQRLGELRELVSKIAEDVGLDSSSLLQGEVDALGKKLEDVRESLTTLVDTAETKLAAQEACTEDLLTAKAFLTSVQKSLVAVDSSSDEGAVQHLNALRNHLLELGKTDGQIQAIRQKGSELPVTKQDVSVFDILQLWQQVFRETFQQYHRLSARLVKSEDRVAALKLWQEYLLHVQAFLASDIPDDYSTLTEQQNLCQVHQNLLNNQQSLLSTKADPAAPVELSVVEQFNTLTNLHNEVLAKIMERESLVRSRLTIWDKYRKDQSLILSWLRDVERERARMKLRTVHMRMVNSTLHRIQALLDKLPHGEEKTARLEEEMTQLTQFCEEALASSLRLEHAAIVERISNLRAALHTWQGFLEGVQALTKRYESEIETVQNAFGEVHKMIEVETVGDSECVLASHHQIQSRLENLKGAKEKVAGLSKELELLGITQEELKESLSPMDMKNINQRVWLLWQQQADLDHQLTILCYQLEEKLKLGQMFNKRQERFLNWCDKIERRMENLSVNVSEPDEVLRRLETELEAEVVLRRREVDWLEESANELITAEGKDSTPRKSEIEFKLKQVVDTWEKLKQLTNCRANKLRHIIQGMNQLEARIEELRSWLHSMEIQLAAPVVLEECTQESLNKSLAQHEELEKSIEKQSGNIGDVLNLCELLLNDCDTCNIQCNTDGISSAMETLERRWKNVCVTSAQRKNKLMSVWSLLQEVIKLCSEQEDWVKLKEECLVKLKTQVDSGQLEELPLCTEQVQAVLNEVEARRPALSLIEQSYSRLTTESAVENLTKDVRELLSRWYILKTTGVELLTKLNVTGKKWTNFQEVQARAVIALTAVDVQLTQIQHLGDKDNSQLETHEYNLSQLLNLEKELESYGELLKNADILGLELMESCVPQDVPKLQKMIDEYQLLWKDITKRMSALIEICKEECRKQQVVNESVQVETLKFEADTSVQVNTLPAPLLRKDAYMYELKTAILECRTNLDALESLEKLTTQNASKCVAACQSSVELMKHLSLLLMEQCNATADEARKHEVDTLATRFEEVLAEKQAKEKRQRETSEVGRLTCPLCCKRNWQQLDNDIWRLQQWLQYAEGTQSSQNSPPSNIEQLEDVIQDQREFLLDLDSHKSLVVSLNIVGTHLAEHTDDEGRASELRQRLTVINKRWDQVCSTAAAWQTQLQTALMENPEFHETMAELVEWLERTENSIRQTEPVNLADETTVILAKYNKFRDLRHDLERCEPRVISLQEAANQLLRHSEAPEGSATTCARLTNLRLRLQSLIRLTGVYLLKLGTVLGRDPADIGAALVTPRNKSLASLSHELLDEASSSALESSSQPDISQANAEQVDMTVLARGYRFLGRVVRASLPIQALMLLMLGVASLVPLTEEDFSCGLTNNFARGLQPILRYQNGPPPV